VAWHLARQGVGVTLIEANTIASGASGGPGHRGVRANFRDPRELPLMARAHEIWPVLHEALGCESLFERTGQLTLIEHDEDLAAAEARVATQNRLGTPTELVTGDALRALEPGLAPFIKAAIHCPNDGVADHGATTRAIAEAGCRAGADIAEGVAAHRVLTRDGRAVALDTSQGEMPVSDHLLLLANAGVRSLVAPWCDLPTWNLTSQVLLSRPFSENPVRHLVGHVSRTLSLKTEPGDRLMITGGHIGRWDDETGRGHALPEAIAANVADAVAVYPALEGIEVEIADADHLEADCIDGVPVIDRVPGLSNAMFATGWTGHGWAISPAVSELLASWLIEGDRPALLAPFSLARFG